MKTFVLGAITASTLALALPAAAQIYVSDRADRVDAAIESGLADGSLSWAAARDLRAQLHDVERMELRYQDDGMTSLEARDLARRYDALSREVDDLID